VLGHISPGGHTKNLVLTVESVGVGVSGWVPG